MKNDYRKCLQLSFTVLAIFSMIAASVMSNPTVFAEPARDDSNVTYSSGISTATATAEELAIAMGIPSGHIVSASLGTSNPDGASVFTDPLAGFPTDKGSYAVMSSGLANDAPMPNLEGSHSGVLGNDQQGALDVTQLTLVLNPPDSAKSFLFDWRFFSDEFPEFVGTAFNDAFLAEVLAEGASTFSVSGSTITADDNVAFDANGDLISINTSGFLEMTAENSEGTTYDGATPTLTTVAPLPTDKKGKVLDEVTIVFSVFDASDHIYDTTVFLDAFKWSDAKVTGGASTSVSPELVAQYFPHFDITSLLDEEGVVLEPGQDLDVEATLFDPSTDPFAEEGIEGETIKFSVAGTSVTGTDTTDESGNVAVTLNTGSLASGFYEVLVEYAGGSVNVPDEASELATIVYQPASTSTLILIGETTGAFDLEMNGKTVSPAKIPYQILAAGTSEVSAVGIDYDEDDIIDEWILDTFFFGGAFFEEPILADDEDSFASMVINEETTLHVDSIEGFVTTLPGGGEPVTVAIGFLFSSEEFEDEIDGDGELSVAKFAEVASSFAFFIMEVGQDGVGGDHIVQFGESTTFGVEDAFACGEEDDGELNDDGDFDCGDTLSFFDQLEGEYEYILTGNEDASKTNKFAGAAAPVVETGGSFTFSMETEDPYKVKKKDKHMSMEFSCDFVTAGEETTIDTDSCEGTVTVEDVLSGVETVFDIGTTLTITNNKATIKGNLDNPANANDKVEKQKFSATLTFPEDLVFAEGGDQDATKATATFKIADGKETHTVKNAFGFFDIFISE